jgi:hypothetical protein
MGRLQWYKIPASTPKRRMFITRKSIVAPLPAQAEQKIGVGVDRCLRLRFRLDQRIAHAVLERVARAGCVSSELENPRSKGLSASGMR